MLNGHAARGAGRPIEALGHYRAAVNEEPESAEANSVYGLMLLQLGRPEEAEAPLRKAADEAVTIVAAEGRRLYRFAHFSILTGGGGP
jgi:Tfp pilus assembly protein PilF